MVSSGHRDQGMVASEVAGRASGGAVKDGHRISERQPQRAGRAGRPSSHANHFALGDQTNLDSTIIFRNKKVQGRNLPISVL